MTDFVRQDAEGFQEMWLQCRRAEREKAVGKDKRRLSQIRKRLGNMEYLARESEKIAAKAIEAAQNAVITGWGGGGNANRAG